MTKKKLVIATLSVACFLTPAYVIGEEANIGQAKAIVRSVSAINEQLERDLKPKNKVFADELIVTKEDSASKLKFLDDTELTVGPKSVVKLDKFVFDPDAGVEELIISTAKGVARFATGRMKKSSYRIITPTAVIGVRGTTFTTNVINPNVIIPGPGEPGLPSGLPSEYLNGPLGQVNSIPDASVNFSSTNPIASANSTNNQENIDSPPVTDGSGPQGNNNTPTGTSIPTPVNEVPAITSPPPNQQPITVEIFVETGVAILTPPAGPTVEIPAGFQSSVLPSGEATTPVPSEGSSDASTEMDAIIAIGDGTETDGSDDTGLSTPQEESDPEAEEDQKDATDDERPQDKESSEATESRDNIDESDSGNSGTDDGSNSANSTEDTEPADNSEAIEERTEATEGQQDTPQEPAPNGQSELSPPLEPQAGSSTREEDQRLTEEFMDIGGEADTLRGGFGCDC